MARLRAHDIASLGRCICAAVLLVVATPATAEQNGGATTAAARTGEAAHDSGHAPPPAANAADKPAPRHGEQPSPPLDRRSKLGAPEIGDMRVVPAVAHVPRMSARDRLFQLMQTAKPRPPARLRPPIPAAASMPIRNAIGVRIDAGASTRAPTMAHWGQRPARLTTVSPTVTNGWHAGVAVPAPPARGGLNGTTLVRVGSGAAVIGGPAKAVTGINGTTLRPKHP